MWPFILTHHLPAYIHRCTGSPQILLSCSGSQISAWPFVSSPARSPLHPQYSFGPSPCKYERQTETHSVSSHVLPHVYLLELQTLPHRLYGLSRYCPVHINHVCVSAENLQAFSSVVLLHVRRDNHNVSWSHACGGTRNTGDVKVHGHVCLKTCTSGDSSNIQGALYLGAGEHTCVQATTEVSFMCLGVQESNNLMFCWHRSCKSTIYLSTAEEQPKQGV